MRRSTMRMREKGSDVRIARRLSGLRADADGIHRRTPFVNEVWRFGQVQHVDHIGVTIHELMTPMHWHELDRRPIHGHELKQSRDLGGGSIDRDPLRVTAVRGLIHHPGTHSDRPPCRGAELDLDRLLSTRTGFAGEPAVLRGAGLVADAVLGQGALEHTARVSDEQSDALRVKVRTRIRCANTENEVTRALLCTVGVLLRTQAEPAGRGSADL